MESRPFQVPKAVSFQPSTSKGETGTIAGYDPMALWRWEQAAGRFVGEYGTMRVFEVKLAPFEERPARIHRAYPYVSKEAFEAAREPMKDFGAASIRRWVEFLTGESVAEQTNDVRGLRLRRSYVQLTLKNAGRRSVPIYLVEVRRNPKQVVAVWITLNPGAPTRDLERAVFQVLEGIQPASRVAARRNDDADARMQSHRVTSPESDRREFRDTREQVIRNIRNLPDWWFVETPHYLIASDLPTSRRAFVRDIQENLTGLHSAFRTLVPPRLEITQVSVVRVFNERQAFLDYLGNNELKEWALGLWMPGRRELVISPFDEANNKRDQDTMMKSIFHEGFHQYVYYALGGVNIPIWINEGHAAFFEGAEVGYRGRTVAVGEADDRLAILEKMLDQTEEGDLGLERMMLLNVAQFYAPDERAKRYSLAWGWVYFLRKAAELYPEQPYDRVCDAVFDACVKTDGDWLAASRTVIDALDMDLAEKHFRDFWTSRTKRARAERRDLFR